MIRVPNEYITDFRTYSEIRRNIESGNIFVGQKYLRNGYFITCIDITKDKYTFTVDNIFALSNWEHLELILTSLYQTGFINGVSIFTKDFLKDIDFLFIPTEKQMFGKNIYGEKEDDSVKQFQLYKEYGNIARIKAIDEDVYRDHEKGETWFYWLSNKYKCGLIGNCAVGSHGTAYYGGASNTNGGVPIFFQMTKRG